MEVGGRGAPRTHDVQLPACTLSAHRTTRAAASRACCYRWAGIGGLEFQANGHLLTPWGTGVWGALPKNVDYNDDGHCATRLGCLFGDFGGGLHNLRFDGEPAAAGSSSSSSSLDAADEATLGPKLRRFKSFRVGDAESVQGTRVDDGPT